MTVADALQTAIPQLLNAGVETPRLDAQLLISWALGVRREDLAREPERFLNSRAEVIFRKAVELRAQRRPLPYITGEAWFYGRPFKVNRAVLIPRPETEMLVDFALSFAEDGGGRDAPLRIADIGTGSGCIGVSAACELPNAYVIATDISRLALLIAAKNCRRYELAARVELREGSLCEPLGKNEHFDLILSNPPYVPSSDAPSLMPEVRDYEPPLALYGTPEVPSKGVNGDLPRTLRHRLLSDARPHLIDGGHIAVEVGIGQANEAAADAESLGYCDVRIFHDAAGIGRVVCGTA